jgi:hypothetical protein
VRGEGGAKGGRGRREGGGEVQSNRCALAGSSRAAK